MEDTLKRLLATEQEANRITELAARNAEQLVEEASLDARSQEERFQKRLPVLRASFTDKAASRAEQSLKEIQRRYDERLEQLRHDAENHESAAIDAAFAVLLHSEEISA
jgi:V/A-type H+-transporting ATPase subunit G/H